MSKRLLKKQAFTDDDFKKGNRIARMYISMMYPEKFKLPEAQRKWLEKVKRSFAVCGGELSRTKAIWMLQENISGLEAWKDAARAYKDMQELFGNFIGRNKEFTRIQYIEKHLQLAHKAEENGEMTEARLNLEAAAKLEQFDKAEQFDPRSLQIPEVSFSTDINVLHKANKEAQEIEVED